MTSMLMAIERDLPFETQEQARPRILAITRAVIGLTHLGRLWTRYRGRHLPIDTESLALLLGEEPSLRGDLPARPTATIPLCARPGGPGDVGFLCVYVRSCAPEKPFSGLRLAVSLSGEVFDLQAGALVRALQLGIDAISADSAMVGPRTPARELGVTWATYVRGPELRSTPTVLAQTRVGGGSIVIAHGGDPTSESPDAREAMIRLRGAIGGETPPEKAGIDVSPSPTHVDRARTLSDISFANLRLPHPANMAVSPWAGASVRVNGQLQEFAPAERGTDRADDHTMEVPLIDAPAEPLPFIAGADVVADFIASIDAGREMCSSMPRQEDMDETAVLGLRVLPAETALTVDQYASLCAEMAASPCDSVTILARYGVASWDAHSALVDAFAARFREDRALQMRWAAGVRRYGDWLRVAGPSRPHEIRSK